MRFVKFYGRHEARRFFDCFEESFLLMRGERREKGGGREGGRNGGRESVNGEVVVGRGREDRREGRKRCQEERERTRTW